MAVSAGGPSPGGWNLWTNGNASVSHAFLGRDSIVTVRAFGQSALGVWPHMIVRVDNQVIGDLNVQATTYSPYQFYYAAPASGPRQVSVSFDNDYYQNGEDRNLFLDALSIEECLSQ